MEVLPARARGAPLPATEGKATAGDDLDALKVERDENDQRKPPTNSERVALALAITAHEKWLAEQRKQASQFGGGGNVSTTEGAGKVRDILAQKVGLGSGKTLEAAQKVIERNIPELVEAMDRASYPTWGDFESG